jgi:hypothetical protein
MRLRVMLSSLLLVVLAACGSEKPDATTVTSARATIDDVTWLIGTWQDDSDTDPLVETWQRGGDALTGSAKSLGTDTFSESMRIEPRDGTLVFIVRVGEGEPVTFTATRVKHNEITFENPAHDYPQRILYQLASKDSLFARIDGATDDETMKEEFSYRRIR